ncbi:hypothetical protein BDW02DRAFT_384012 [Decorospora gaudefroyi]|uniref:Uncharacterized protein n=1 Tax=Decorospora gaudefroyi TaxID=184978 RepID=A0A6A5KAP1_9PLEO|nr:hypothetical protein BDW02DRAFT_384012 [Decorospora gaudefroyi]
MVKSIELGRAVLSSPGTNLELWLNTLITISPQQGEDNLLQLKNFQLLDFFSSSAAWVGRGHGMHMVLEITLGEEALAYEHLQPLTDALLRAPVWEQLRLKPSLPIDAAVGPGTVRLDINHAEHVRTQEKQKHHRLFPDVPAVDIQPPHGVPLFSLQSIRLSMDIIESSPRQRSTAKRSNTSPGESRNPHAEVEDSDMILHEMIAVDGVLHDTSRGAGRKRKRPVTDTAVMTPSINPNKDTPSKRSRKELSTPSLHDGSVSQNHTSSNRADIENIVDGALRLSICGSLNKSPNNLKMKAGTFRLGLADIAPALWRNGYLTALSHRAHLIPTIARSFSQIAGVRATSISLKNKMFSLASTSRLGIKSNLTLEELSTGNSVAQLSSSVASRLWVHSQEALSNKSTSSLQACVAPYVETAQSKSDEMLAEEERPLKYQHEFMRNIPTVDFIDDSPTIVSDDGPVLHRTLSVSSTHIEENLLKRRNEGYSNHGTDPEFFGDDLLLLNDTKPDHPIASGGYMCGGEPVALYSSSDGLTSILRVLSKELDIIQESQNSLGIVQDEELPSHTRGVPMSAEAGKSQEEESLFEECGEHNIETIEDLLLPF